MVTSVTSSQDTITIISDKIILLYALMRIHFTIKWEPSISYTLQICSNQFKLDD